jgi:hypothetical protein
MIINNFKLQDFPMKSNMKVTCRRFHQLIEAEYFSIAEIMVLERLPYWMENSLYACTLCARLLPKSRFSDKMCKGKRGKNGYSPSKRFCITCVGLRPSPISCTSRYTRGTYVEIWGLGYMCCAQCDRFQLARSKSSKNCISCALGL